GPATTIPHRMIEEAWRSRAIVAITTLQDVLSLGTGARMNMPSTPSGNWGWRFGEDDLTDRTAGWLRKLNRKTGRV
ncbi:MAG: 4-alpha-glucanotransferase, partial [Actinobacteria bacterium]|nr:4-alpha-glucanotransferase [Actinomycetota bacterium]